MPGDLALKISANQWVEVELRELHSNLTGPQIAQTYHTVNVQLRVFEIRASTQLHIFAMRLRQNRHAANRLTIQHNIAEIDLAIDDRGISSAGAGQMKAGLPLNGKARQVKTLKVGEIDIGAG